MLFGALFIGAHIHASGISAIAMAHKSTQLRYFKKCIFAKPDADWNKTKPYVQYAFFLLQTYETTPKQSTPPAVASPGVNAKLPAIYYYAS